MKKYAFFFISLFFFNGSICMEKDQSVRWVLDKMKFIQEKIRYFIIQKNLPEILNLLREIKKNETHLSWEGKKDINDRIIDHILDFLQMTEELTENFKAEYYPQISRRSSLARSVAFPRIEISEPCGNLLNFDDNESQIISTYNLSSFLSQEECESEIGSSVKKDGKKTRFLIGIIEHLEAFSERIDKIDSALRILAENENTDQFIELYETNEIYINPNNLNSTGKSYYHYAVANDNKIIMLFLMQKGAYKEIVDMHGDTPLLQAIKYGKIDTMYCLLDNGANPYARDKDGLRQELEGSKIKFNPIDTYGAFDPLRLDNHKNYIEISEVLKKYIENMPDDSKFRFMAQSGRVINMMELIRKLISPKDADSYERVENIIDSRDRIYNRSALHYAIERQQPRAIIYLLSIYSDPNLQDFEGNTPLHCAVITNYVQGVLLLLFGKTDEIESKFEFKYSGAIMDLKNEYGYTPEEIANLLENKAVITAFKDKRKADKDYAFGSYIGSNRPRSRSEDLYEESREILEKQSKQKSKKQLKREKKLAASKNPTRKRSKSAVV